MSPSTPAFRTYATVALTSTTTSQNILMPTGQANLALCVYNAGANVVYLAIGATSAVTVAEPASFAAGIGIISVTAGGKLVVSVGDGF
jgi:hypothetical protein